ncbi:MAG: hypothetical protein QNK23_04065 [Crocinitomicaceae bacterium]|nr:hypothetical protein [Crocinitomicaceae bacterium]
MIKTLSLLIVCLLSLTSMAQQYDVEWSGLERSKGRLIYLLPSDSNEFYALRWSGGQLFGTYQVSRHKDLKLVSSARLQLYANNSIANFEGARVIGGQFVVFLSDKHDGKNNLYMKRYDDDLKLIDQAILLASYDLDRNMGKGSFDIRMSSNKEFFAVVWEIKGKKDARNIYGFKIFDTQLNVINEGEYPVPFDRDLSKIHSHHISNSGDYFLALTEYEEKERKVFQRMRLKYKALHIFHIAEDGLLDYELDLGGKRVEAMAMTSNDSNVFILTGIYGEMEEQGVSGVFHQRVDLSTGKKLDEGFMEFEEDFITEGWSDRAVKRAERRADQGKGDPQLYNYQMREITILPDGSIVGTMEQYYVQVRSFSNVRTGQSSNTYYYYYNDIIAYKIGTDSKFGWVQKIRKSQVSANDGGPFSSYETFIDNGQVHFIFNDNVKNFDENGNFIDVDRLHVSNYGRKNNVVALASIDLETGETERKPFFGRTEIEALAVPKLFNVNYPEAHILLYAIWGKKEKIGFLNLNH